MSLPQSQINVYSNTVGSFRLVQGLSALRGYTDLLPNQRQRGWKETRKGWKTVKMVDLLESIPCQVPRSRTEDLGVNLNIKLHWRNSNVSWKCFIQSMQVIAITIMLYLIAPCHNGTQNVMVKNTYIFISDKVPAIKQSIEYSRFAKYNRSQFECTKSNSTVFRIE